MHGGLDYVRAKGTNRRYGYQTSTQLTFLLFLDHAARGVQEADVQTIFQAIHRIYGLYTSNPFAAIQPGELFPSAPMDAEALRPSLPPDAEPSRAPITSNLFHQRVSDLCEWTVNQAAV